MNPYTVSLHKNNQEFFSTVILAVSLSNALVKVNAIESIAIMLDHADNIIVELTSIEVYNRFHGLPVE